MANYVPLRRIVLNSEASAILINNLPTSGYSHLKVVTTLRATNGSANWALISYNTQPDTTVDLRHIIGDANTAASQAYSSGRVFTTNTSMTSDTFAVSEFVIYNYNDPNYYKVIMSQSGQETNTTSPRPSTSVSAQMWNSTLPINSIRFTVDGGGNFAAYSSISVYGLPSQFDAPVVSPKATGGDIIGTDGNYWYHAFLKTGVFNPKISLSCEYLIVSGGGAGGNTYNGAGGGAGGLRSLSGVITTAITATVGAGGTAGAGANGRGGNGSSSSFNGSSSTGGGGGGYVSTDAGNPQYAGLSGGSGGGGQGSSLSGSAGGSGNAGGYSPVEGYDGGAGSYNQTPYYGSGGGGGAGGVGAPGSGAGGGRGGIGSDAFASWLFATGTGVSGYIAGGGGGGWYSAGGTGPGGLGGGGAGSNANGTAGTANTGGGGGGGERNGTNPTGGAGGSGIVIVRYAV
jgi:hypothetical protein